MSGWGEAEWGGSSWGSGGEELRLLGAHPVRENVVRLEFNVAVRLSFLSDPRDGALPDRYAFTPVAGTSGKDGFPTRPVLPFSVARARFALSRGRYLDVTVDRAFSPYPARYLVSVNRLVALDGLPLLSAHTSAEMDGLARGLPVMLPELTIGRGDLAGTVEGAEGVLLPVDGAGDVGTDRGLASLRKRVLRRLLTRRGAFVGLPGYGVGTAGEIKRLATPSVRTRLVAEAEAQIRREPEVEEVRASLVPIPGRPGAWRLSVRVRTRAGSLSAEARLLAG